MKSLQVFFVLVFMAMLFVGALLAPHAKADNEADKVPYPRYECKNGKCTLLPRPRLTAAPTPADEATKPIAQKTEIIASVECNESQAEHVAKGPLRSVLVKTANRSACLSRGILRRVFSRCR